MTFPISIAQLNFLVGDPLGNARLIIDAATKAHARGSKLLVTPELALCGYIAEDLFLRPAFIDACCQALFMVVRETAHLVGLTIIVGHPIQVTIEVRQTNFTLSLRTNSASVIRNGQVIATYDKQELPNYQVFDERRYFEPGKGVCVFEVDTIEVGLVICEDAWVEEPALLAKQAGAQLLVVINASPFHSGKGLEREEKMQQRVTSCGLPLIYAHMVGGQDEVVFDGHSFAVDEDGSIAARAPSFVESLFDIEVQVRADASIHLLGQVTPPSSELAELWGALVLGLRDYMQKNHFASAVLGLSGGVDSALVLAIAVDALGADCVRAVMMPSPYTASMSLEDAREMARRMNVRYDEISIEPTFEAFKHSLAPIFSGRAEDTTEENIQARIRGVMLMAISNKMGALVLTTGNKSEYATGYCTLYGDMCGGFAPIKDVVKTKVFELARWRNAHDPFNRGSNPIPLRIITRAPSAELRSDQTDQDSLPPYETVDAIIEHYVEQDCSIAQLSELGFKSEDIDKVTRLIKNSEYKRRQGAEGTRVTPRAFGKDWRYPITNQFRN